MRRFSRARSAGHGRVGMLEHVVEREQTTHEHGRGGDPAVSDVLGA